MLKCRCIYFLPTRLDGPFSGEGSLSLRRFGGLDGWKQLYSLSTQIPIVRPSETSLMSVLRKGILACFIKLVESSS